MSEQESVWYYTQHGERKGPVTLEVLRGAIEHMKIDREKDLIWGPGLSDWVTMEKVPELQGMPSGPPPVTASPQVEPPAPIASTVSQPSPPASGIGSAPLSTSAPALVNPYKSPASLEDDNSLADAMAERREGDVNLGMGRLMFWFAPTVVSVIIVVGTMFLAGSLSGENPNTITSSVVIGYLVATVICLFMTFSRLKNLGMSRWSVLWSFIPIMSFWLFYRLYICPAGYNDHKKLDGAGKALVGVSILFIVGYFGAVLTVGASYYKEAADKAQQKIEEQQRAKQESSD